jgi:hypothetical protein
MLKVVQETEEHSSRACSSGGGRRRCRLAPASLRCFFVCANNPQRSQHTRLTDTPLNGGIDIPTNKG